MSFHQSPLMGPTIAIFPKASGSAWTSTQAAALSTTSEIVA